MTEVKWLTCTDPDLLLDYLGEPHCERKHRLFACACAYRLWLVYPDDRCRDLIKLAERFADGQCDQAEMESESDQFHVWEKTNFYEDSRVQASMWVAGRTVWLPMNCWLSGAIAVNAVVAVAWYGDIDKTVEANEKVMQVAIIRDIFGNPFRPVTVDQSWLTSTVVTLAKGINDERAFDRMPILADAFQDAGCDNDDILNHCRSDAPHVRGCWVVDLVLGKS